MKKIIKTVKLYYGKEIKQFFFKRRAKTWHAYKGDGASDRIIACLQSLHKKY